MNANKEEWMIFVAWQLMHDRDTPVENILHGILGGTGDNVQFLDQCFVAESSSNVWNVRLRYLVSFVTPFQIFISQPILLNLNRHKRTHCKVLKQFINVNVFCVHRFGVLSINKDIYNLKLNKNLIA